MSDSLHDRIAAAIKQVDDTRVCKLSNADIKFMADAVIAELGLRQENSYAWNNNRSWKTGTRYVTNWKADDE